MPRTAVHVVGPGGCPIGLRIQPRNEKFFPFAGQARTPSSAPPFSRRFPFRVLPAASGGELTPRPVVDIALDGPLAAPMECLLDTGALPTRMSAELAPLAGIELDGAATEEFFVAGLKTAGALARVNLTVTDGAEEFSWDAPVWFCDPWPGSSP